MARSRRPLSVSAGGASSKLPRLAVAKRRRAAFIAICRRALHAVDRIAECCVALTEIIEQRGQRRKLAPDRGRRPRALFHILAPGDDVRPRDRPQLRVTLQTGIGDKFAHIGLIGPAGFGVGDVGQPFLLRRDVSELVELRPRQGAVLDRNQVRSVPLL
jgi:hypothetical protein